ncbi:RNA polymerase sigma-70 factor (ECF subfamily) [Catenuloplanes nepalensis]|uniref:RNA polymerase sigma-70 factor (ECF subfamily) n=2 Tax=Catenuloplanes nepalensis TaxID=587533 RepID=A0ABT9MLM9_9ACTN|nr:SigE family RNA polymerase sigma factor [Catenuloplanes nepalensis]MDP9792332.1 RNA polymerase sigma-70 factor (ECF subfamily) [Catenuloplanes nepalensis]
MTMVSEAARALTDDTGPPTFESFYAAHFQRLSLQLFAYTGDFGQAQDVVQEAFCRALPRWEKVSHYDDPLAWLRKVAWNLATSRFRRLRVQQAHARRYREEHVDGPGPDRVALARALATLPEKHRRAVILYHLADLSIAQIAEQEDVAEGTVKSWLHRGRTALAAQLIDA